MAETAILEFADFDIDVLAHTTADLTVPPFTITASVSKGASIEFPPFSLEAATGEQAHLAFGDFDIVASVTNTDFDGSIEFPSFTITARADRNEAHLEFFGFDVAAVVDNPQHILAAIEFPPFEIDVTTENPEQGVGAIIHPPFDFTVRVGARAAITVPPVTVGVTVSRPQIAQAVLEWPPFEVDVDTGAWQVEEAHLEFPSFQVGTGTGNIVQAHLEFFGFAIGGEQHAQARGGVLLNPAASVEYKAYAMTLKNGATTIIDHWPFNFQFRFRNEHYGVTNDGVYKLDGTVPSVNKEIDVFPTRFQKDELKRIIRGYVKGRFDADIKVTLTADEDLETRYVIRNMDKPGVVERRFKASRNAKQRGNYWGIKVENTEGGRLDVEGILLLADLIGRNFR